MNMLVAPAPLPEEIDRGYLGRVMRINGYRNLQNLSDAITELQQLPASPYGRSWHALLSGISGLSSEQFTLRHTTLPLRRGITSYFPDAPHGGESRPLITAKNTVLRTYVAAFLCEQCVRADIAFHGVSYWRRDHQTLGQFWCSKHFSPLSCTTEPDAMLCSPAQYLSKASLLSIGVVQDAQANGFVQRYLELVAAMYERTAPLSVARIAPVLRDRAKFRGFQANVGPVRAALVSDHIREACPVRWLEGVFPGLIQKPPGVFLPQIDGALYMRQSSSSTTAYLLVLAALFDTADEAVNLLQAAHSGVHVPKVLKERTVLKRYTRYALPADNELIDSYVSARGSVVRTAQAFTLPKHIIQKRLLDLGFPNLDGDLDQPGTPIAGLQSFYVHKRAYAESLTTSGMTARRFDALLRKCGPNLFKAFVKMAATEKRCSRKDLAHSLLCMQADHQFMPQESAVLEHELFES
ncbi:TniQ family protein [Acidovorax sp. Be4]|uniref:TniQ family protein n=1 Tax=Acidovorax bellezanensis TaxID=2976702 RepID=A0ABT2PSL0_9BURK|nr:TniQ family protein [Acidovorax sp. Be4]MCT9813213.1 TniQ family protein [Acidovorax sp. Be4]